MWSPEDAEKTRLVTEDDPDATVLAGPDVGATVAVAPDPEATVLAASIPDPAQDPEATQLADARATQLADAAPTQLVGAAPTRRIVDVPAFPDVTERMGEAAPDGIDTLGTPDFAPATLDDLTEAHAPVSISSPVQSLPERKRRLPRWAVALIVVVVLAAAGAGVWWTYEQEYWGGKTVPAVVGLSEADATQALEQLGFEVSVEYRSADDGFGTVLSCSPAPGVRSDPAAGATLTVASERTIPAVVGLTADEASAALREAGATDITLTYQNSDEPAGTVLAVDPAEGSAFTSFDPVTLTVAHAYTVPDVVGMALADAQAALEAQGLTSTVTYVESDAAAYSVVATSPEAGAEVTSGSSVELSVSTPYPSDPWQLLGYFDIEPADISSYLTSQGFSLSFGELYAAGGNAHTAWSNAAGDVLTISDEPERGNYESTSGSDVLAGGAAVGGVRYAFSASSAPQGATAETDAGVQAVMSACGLTGLTDLCTQDDLVIPEELGVTEEDLARVHFICATGRQGDYTWAVLIGGVDADTKVVALVAPTAHFSALDLAAYGGSVCDYVACSDLFRG